MSKTMNLMQFVYSDELIQDTAKEADVSYREAMTSVLHDCICIKDIKYAPIKFRVVNGEPYAEWVEHTAAEWNKLLEELALLSVGRSIAEAINNMLRGDDNDEQRS